jgi:predicted RNA-binding Zn-ribbon protein involved in translation (DUF1610 family)
VLAVCLLLAGLYAWRQQWEAHALRAYSLRVEQVFSHGLVLVNRLDTLLQQHWQPPGLTRAQLEAELNEGRPFAPSNLGPQHAVWQDPVGFTVQLQFDEGRWTGWDTSGPPAIPYPPAPQVLQVGETIRGAVFYPLPGRWTGGISLPGPAAFLWLILLGVCCPWWRPLRVILAELSLALAVLSTAAWLFWPGYDIGSRMNDLVCWGVGMIVISMAVFVPLMYVGRKRNLFPHCQACGYNLTGNVSGRCPECGQEVPKEYRTRLIELPPGSNVHR